ncbi:hypothetical protein GCM10020229_56790 [Kitasatospora albolonga]
MLAARALGLDHQAQGVGYLQAKPPTLVRAAGSSTGRQAGMGRAHRLLREGARVGVPE